MKKSTIIILVVLAVVAIVAIIYRKKIASILGFGGNEVRINGGMDTTSDDEACAGYYSGKIIENCTKPLYNKLGYAKERAWLLESTDYPFSECLGTSTLKTPDGQSWFYNYQSGAKCVYINDNRFPAQG